MGVLLAVLGGVLAGIVMRRVKADIPTRFIFNIVIFALVIAQTVLFFFKSTLPAGACLIYYWYCGAWTWPMAMGKAAISLFAGQLFALLSPAATIGKALK